MKRGSFLFFIYLYFSLFLYSQNPGGGIMNTYYTPKAYDIFPVADSEINLNEGDGKLVPYDYYATFNCPVTHTLDSVFYAECDSALVTIESTKPCYVIIYDLHNEQNGLFNVIKVDTYSNGKYRKTTKLVYEFWGLCRIIATKGTYALKKITGSGTTPSLGFSDSEDNIGEEEDQSRSASSPDCSISIYNYENNETSYVEGDIANNMYFLSGNVVTILGKTYSDAVLPQQSYTVFTANSTTNVDMFVLSDDDEIIAHNNNYTGTSGHNWGTEARVNMTGSETPKAIVLLPYRSYIEHESEYLYWGNQYIFQDNTPDGTTDLYLGCKYESVNNSFAYIFPNFHQEDALISDPDRTNTNYNCHAWTAYPTDKCFREFYLYSPFHDATSIAYFLSHYHGFTETGATEANSEVDIWEHLGSATHTSVKSYGGGAGGNSYGYAWESKLGQNNRVMHPRYALINDDTSNNTAYGHVVKYMIKDPYYTVPDYVFENVEFTEREFDLIDSLVNMTSQEDRFYFNSRYEKVKEYLDHSYISNLSILSRFHKDYQELSEACGKNICMLAHLIEKLSIGEPLSAILTIEAISRYHEDIVNNIVSYEKENNVNSNGKEIRRTDISEATLYAKAILAKLFKQDLPSSKTRISYSDCDDYMSISCFNRTIFISFQLDEPAQVSVLVENISRQLFSSAIERRLLDRGSYLFSISVKDKGIYAVNAEVNGKIYRKKIFLNY